MKKKMNSHLIKITYKLMTNKSIIFFTGLFLILGGIFFLNDITQVTEDKIIIEKSPFLFFSLLGIYLGLTRLELLLDLYRIPKLKKGFKKYNINFKKETLSD